MNKIILNERHYNILKESPDDVIKRPAMKYDAPDGVSFGVYQAQMYVGYNEMYLNNINRKDVIRYIQSLGLSVPFGHDNIMDFYEVYKNDESYMDMFAQRENFDYSGRVWVKRRTVSFWKYPKTQDDLFEILLMLNDELEDIYNINLGKLETLSIELTNGDIVLANEYNSSDDRSEEELKSQHTVTPSEKDMNDPRRLSYIQMRNNNYKLPSGMSQAEYNARVRTSESKEYTPVKINKVRQGIMAYENVEKDNYTLGFESGGQGYAHIIDEIVDSSEVDLTSFKPQETLNNDLWINNKLNSRVRLRLLDIADNFIDKLNVPWVEISDIIITGSAANYNWSKYSDIDLHILLDFKEVDEKTEFVKNYFDAQKALWNDEHEDLKIYGFPVEVYVQDINEKHNASGIYSLEKNEWLVEPSKSNIETIKLDKYIIKEKSFNLMRLIEKLEKEVNTTSSTDTYNLDVLSKKVKKLWDKIKNIRKHSLLHGGEMSAGNIVFKVLRRTEYLGRLYNLKVKLYDYINSLYK